MHLNLRRALCGLTSSAVLFAGGAASAQTFVRCTGVHAPGRSTETPFDAVYAFEAPNQIWAVEIGNRLATRCDVGTRPHDVVGENSLADSAFYWEDEIQCEVSADLIAVRSSTPAQRGLGRPWFTEVEIYRSTGEVRVMVGHSFEGSGRRERIEDPRSAAPAF